MRVLPLQIVFGKFLSRFGSLPRLTLLLCSVSVCALAWAPHSQAQALTADKPAAPAPTPDLREGWAAALPGERAVQDERAAPAAETPANQGQGLHEGITVHGYWKIDVRNPNGSLAQHVEFENSLLSDNQQGAITLEDLLSGQVVNLSPFVIVRGGTGLFQFTTVGKERIQMPELDLNGPCGTFNGAGTDCLLVPTASAIYSNCLWAAAQHPPLGYTSEACVPGLSVVLQNKARRSSTGEIITSSSLQLQGSFTVGTAATIQSVATAIATCSPADLSKCAAPSKPGSVATEWEPPLYLTSYSPGIKVTAGQAVNVTVNLSFQ